MKPAQLDLPTIWRGCTWENVILTWKDNNGNPFDLTGWTPYCQTRSGTNLNPVVTNASAGQTKLSLTRFQSAAMNLGNQQWDWVWWNDVPNGTKYPPILSGTVLVDQPTTHTFTEPNPEEPPPQ